MTSIKEIDDAIKEVFDSYEALNIDTTYEKEGENEKLIIFLNKLYAENTSVLYTKLIFLVDADKVNLKKNSFLYLYDINCVYRNIEFSDINDFKNKIKFIFDKEKFGDDIKILSKFMEYPSTMINNWLSKQNVTNINVRNIRYSPKIDIVPCKYLSFDFKMQINNTEVQLLITKEGKDDYRYEFVYPEKNDKISKINLKDLIETIGISIKNNIQ
jgi:hypothetical protein